MRVSTQILEEPIEGEQAQIVKQIKVGRKAALLYIDTPIEKIRQVVDGVVTWVPSGNTLSNCRIWMRPRGMSGDYIYLHQLAPELYTFCDTCMCGSTNYDQAECGFGEHIIKITSWDQTDINVAGKYWPDEKSFNMQLLDEESWTPELRKREEGEVDGHLVETLSTLPDVVFVNEEADFEIYVVNDTLPPEGEEDTFLVEFAIELSFRNTELNKEYTKWSSFYTFLPDEEKTIPVSITLPNAAVPSDQLFVMYEVFATLWGNVP